MKRLLVLAAVARPVYVFVIRGLLRRNAARLMAGDPAPLLRMYADDAVLEFPGESTWGPEYRGKAEIEGFLRRFLDAGLRGSIGQIWVSGPPWATRLAVEFDDWAYDAGGTTKVYENRSMLVLETRFGKVIRERVYEDTQKVAAFDEWLIERDAVAA
jgi:ketosteroid isomerase-like protein